MATTLGHIAHLAYGYYDSYGYPKKLALTGWDEFLLVVAIFSAPLLGGAATLLAGSFLKEEFKDSPVPWVALVAGGLGTYGGTWWLYNNFATREQDVHFSAFFIAATGIACAGICLYVLKSDIGAWAALPGFILSSIGLCTWATAAWDRAGRESGFDSVSDHLKVVCLGGIWMLALLFVQWKLLNKGLNRAFRNW